ncbi:MAG: type ISP restriction/modification enzyme, partial [Elusimicrobiota bacterium]
MKDNKKIFQEYLREIRSRFQTEDYTEATLRTPFENFIKNLNTEYNLIQEPKKIEKIGVPDFKAYRRAVKVGYIETKDLHRDLDSELESEQVKRYQESINNIILTNYRRFILIRNSEKIFDINLFNLSDLKNSKYIISEKDISEFQKLIDTFFDYKTPTIASAKELAVELSKKAKLLRELAREQLEEDLSTSNTQSSVYDFYEALRELIKDVNVDKCVDAYAQTITYGLFLAKMRHPNTIDRETASSHIPPSIGVIRRIFSNISGDALPSSLSWIIDETVDILNASDMKNIVKEIDLRGKKDKDPFTHFYEDFLALYDPEQRKHLGNYYTPRPVINFICNSVNTILRDDFDKAKGFAEDDVTVLDPAVGTGTFLWLVYTLTLLELLAHRLGGLKEEKIENHILKDFYGFEILITPYIIAHLKLAMILQRWDYDLKETERIQVYLTNTLEPQVSYGLIPFMRELSQESMVANEVKSKKPILVILGNPPYYGMSANTGQWITDLVKKGYTRADGSEDKGYYFVDGKPLKEKNPKWLLDDYVKFIRFAQWKIDTISGKGIVGFITNHSYLDNPTFKGMRQSLFESFDRIYILNLHGSTLRKETCPDGSPDENVFDIRPGVAITLFIKNEKFKDKKVYYADLYGIRDYKYKQLDKISLNTIKWEEVQPKSPNYYFVPIDASLEKEYKNYWKITDIFPLNGVGITTARDSFVIDFDKDALLTRIKQFKNSIGYSDDRLHHTFKIRRKKGWDIRKAWNMLQEISDSELKEYVLPILYRPFDVRWIFYHDAVVWRTVKRVMLHMLKENIGLISARSNKSDSMDHFFVTDKIMETKCGERTTQS